MLHMCADTWEESRFETAKLTMKRKKESIARCLIAGLASYSSYYYAALFLSLYILTDVAELKKEDFRFSQHILRKF